MTFSQSVDVLPDQLVHEAVDPIKRAGLSPEHARLFDAGVVAAEAVRRAHWEHTAIRVTITGWVPVGEGGMSGLNIGIGPMPPLAGEMPGPITGQKVTGSWEPSTMPTKLDRPGAVV